MVIMYTYSMVMFKITIEINFCGAGLIMRNLLYFRLEDKNPC